MQLSSQSQQRLESIFTQPVFIGCTTEILRDKLQERSYTVQWLENALQRCGNRCEKWNLILLCAMLLATKMLLDFMTARYVTRCRFTGNLCRNSALSSCLITFWSQTTNTNNNSVCLLRPITKRDYFQLVVSPCEDRFLTIYSVRTVCEQNDAHVNFPRM